MLFGSQPEHQMMTLDDVELLDVVTAAQTRSDHLVWEGDRANVQTDGGVNVANNGNQVASRIEGPRAVGTAN